MVGKSVHCVSNIILRPSAGPSIKQYGIDQYGRHENQLGVQILLLAFYFTI